MRLRPIQRLELSAIGRRLGLIGLLGHVWWHSGGLRCPVKKRLLCAVRGDLLSFTIAPLPLRLDANGSKCVEGRHRQTPACPQHQLREGHRQCQLDQRRPTPEALLALRRTDKVVMLKAGIENRSDH